MLDIKIFLISLFNDSRSKMILNSFSDVDLINDLLVIETKKELIEIYKSEIIPIIKNKISFEISLIGI